MSGFLVAVVLTASVASSSPAISVPERNPELAQCFWEQTPQSFREMLTTSPTIDGLKGTPAFADAMKEGFTACEAPQTDESIVTLVWTYQTKASVLWGRKTLSEKYGTKPDALAAAWSGTSPRLREELLNAIPTGAPPSDASRSELAAIMAKLGLPDEARIPFVSYLMGLALEERLGLSED